MNQITLEGIRAHCEEIGDCWEWRSNATSRKRRKHPQIWTGSECLLARRVAYELHKGPVPADRYIVPRCGNECCINPQHQKVLTREQNATRTGRIRSAVAGRPGKIAAGRRKSAKLTPEAVREICASEELQAVLAQRYGVSQSMISRVRLGKAWRDHASPFAGLFSGLVAANESHRRAA